MDEKAADSNANATKNESNAMLPDIKEMTTGKGGDGILKFYTVGDGSVKTLANNYTLQSAALVAAEENALKEQKDKEDMNKYVTCFLDVPADCSGVRPHQGMLCCVISLSSTDD